MSEISIDERAGAADQPVPDPLEPILARIRSHFRLSPTDIMRIHRAATLLTSRGIKLDDESAIAAWLAPVVCRSPAEQQDLYEMFGAPKPEEIRIRRDAEKEGEAEEPPTGPWWKTFSLRMTAIWAVSLLAAIALVVYLARGTEESAGNHTAREAAQTAAADVNLATDPDPVSNEAEAPASPPQGWTPAQLAMLIVAAVFLLALAAFVIAGWKRRRLRSSPPPDTVASDQAVFGLLLPSLFGGTAFRHGLGVLRRHQVTESRKLHIGRTVRATIKAGGRPVLRHGTRPRTPEYVVLANRESPQDLMPVVADLLVQRMAEEKINATLYEFYRDPRRLTRTRPQAEAGQRRLADLAASFSGARLMMVAERRSAIDEARGPAPWLDHFTAFDQPALLDPGEQAGKKHFRIGEDLTLLTVPLSSDGLMRYGRNLAGLTDRGGDALSPEVDDPIRALEPFWQSLLDDEPPEDVDLDLMLSGLERWLGGDGMRVFRMAAVFPLVEPALTLLLLKAAGSDAGQMDERLLVKVARLPWMRHGYFPSWLRLRLVRGLAPGDLETATDTAIAYLSGEVGEDGANSAADQLKVRRRLRLWLRANRSSEYSDPLFIAALEGATPAELGAGDGDSAPRRWRERLRKRPVQAVLGLFALSIFATMGAILYDYLTPDDQPPYETTPENEIIDPTREDPINRPEENSAGKEVIDDFNESIEDAANTAADSADANSIVTNGTGPVIDVEETTPPSTRDTWRLEMSWSGGELTASDQRLLDQIPQIYSNHVDRSGGPVAIRVRVVWLSRGYGSDSAESLRRAQEAARRVTAYLVGRGVPADAIEPEIVGMSEEDQDSGVARTGISLNIVTKAPQQLVN